MTKDGLFGEMRKEVVTAPLQKSEGFFQYHKRTDRLKVSFGFVMCVPLTVGVSKSGEVTRRPVSGRQACQEAH